ncbi:MAG TPA: PQQ-binding-like beta-propeller repeat protein, partial [Planctomycetaceae bacterium]|nr:PQQ-binding-like beta-propeller repeat protein [Planctomycetaceae bacterium]
ALLLGLFWPLYAVLRWTDLGVSLGFTGFVALYGAAALALLLFAVWWLAASRVGWAERLGLFALAVFVGGGAAFLADRTALGVLFMPGLPLVLTTWTLGLAIAWKWRPKRRAWALAGVLGLTWAPFLLVRTEGVGGDFQPTLRPRWTPTPEKQYLEEDDVTGEQRLSAGSQYGLTLQPGDWPGFRGDQRDGIVRGVRLLTDWEAVPPKLLWRRRIGPAWSSIAVVGDRLYTQEQHGPLEAVVCLDAASGRTLWSHHDTARHEDGQGEAGPRATPTFAENRIFALGAKGKLNCLDPVSGDRKWSRDIAVDAGTQAPVWGFASSPLVVGDLVVVFAGSEISDSQRNLLAYHRDSGELVWSAAAGRSGYSSAHRALLGDSEQVLFVSDGGIFAFELSSGAALWQHAAESANFGIPRVVQPRIIGANAILFDAGPDAGTTLVSLAGDGTSWTSTKRWVSRQLKPSFNDFVIHDRAMYGFDGRVFTCLDLETGKRRWKEGRYGSGQVLLLEDQPLLVVITDEGQVVLVAANPEEHKELGRFQAVEGKTWNHPAIAHGRLYIRNAAEIACYELPVGAKR